MNQILYTGGKNKKSKTTDTQKIVIFFVIFIVIFAICMIVIGGNLLSKVKNNNPEQPGISNTTPDTPDTPENPPESNIEISFEPTTGGVILLVESTLNIDEITYWWDEESKTSFEPDSTEYELEIPTRQGSHTLYVEVIDENGHVETEEQEVIGDSEPELTIKTDKISNYVIIAKDDEEIEKLVIVLNGETQEVMVNAKEIEHKVPIPQGYSLIEVTAYNLNGISVTKKAKITNFGG